MAIKRKIVRDKTPVIPEVSIEVVQPPTPQPAPRAVRTPSPAPVTPVVTQVINEGGKFRRLKENGVAKVRRFERDLSPTDRDIIIRWWNQNQRLITDEDPACARLTTLINDELPGLPLSPMQVAGYFSYLCRLGQWADQDRQTRIQRSIAQGRFTVAPVYSRGLLNEIVENWEREREDERLRREAHARLRAARASGQALRIRSGDGVRAVIQVAPTPVMRTLVSVSEEIFDIKWM